MELFYTRERGRRGGGLRQKNCQSDTRSKQHTHKHKHPHLQEANKQRKTHQAATKHRHGAGRWEVQIHPAIDPRHPKTGHDVLINVRSFFLIPIKILIHHFRSILTLLTSMLYINIKVTQLLPSVHALIQGGCSHLLPSVPPIQSRVK